MGTNSSKMYNEINRKLRIYKATITSLQLSILKWVIKWLNFIWKREKRFKIKNWKSDYPIRSKKISKLTCLWSLKSLEKNASIVKSNQSFSKFPTGTCCTTITTSVLQYLKNDRFNKTGYGLSIYMRISRKKNSFSQPLGWSGTSLHTNFSNCSLPT